MVDKEWTKFPRFRKEYINGVELFLDFAYTSGRPQGMRFCALVLSVEIVVGQEEM